MSSRQEWNEVWQQAADFNTKCMDECYTHCFVTTVERASIYVKRKKIRCSGKARSRCWRTQATKLKRKGKQKSTWRNCEILYLLSLGNAVGNVLLRSVTSSFYSSVTFVWYTFFLLKTAPFPNTCLKLPQIYVCLFYTLLCIINITRTYFTWLPSFP